MVLTDEIHESVCSWYGYLTGQKYQEKQSPRMNRVSVLQMHWNVNSNTYIIHTSII